MLLGKRPDVLQAVIEACELGNLIPSKHAQDQMDTRDIRWSDIEEMICRARRESAKDSRTSDGKDWKYALRGTNDFGDKDLRIIVVFVDPKVIIVTAIDKNKAED